MEKTLVVLAAGMGSRFGRLKQLEPVGPSKEFLIDYSVYDAKRAGFTKVVFVIKKENKEAFEETISQRINGIEVEYAYQEMENIPLNTKIDRVKPLGTAHALYCAKDKVKGPFGLISADDFYGNESFEILSNYLDNNEGICVVGYPIGATLSEEGEVKRGVVLSNNNKIEAIIESKVKVDGDKVSCTPLNGKPSFEVSKENPCSMLMYGFNTDIFEKIENMLIDFLKNADLSTGEFLLPDVVDEYVKMGKVNVVSTPSTWIGMTYKDDLPMVQEKIREYIDNGIYPENLWNDYERKNR